MSRNNATETHFTHMCVRLAASPVDRERESVDKTKVKSKSLTNCVRSAWISTFLFLSSFENPKKNRLGHEDIKIYPNIWSKRMKKSISPICRLRAYGSYWLCARLRVRYHYYFNVYSTLKTIRQFHVEIEHFWAHAIYVNQLYFKWYKKKAALSPHSLECILCVLCIFYIFFVTAITSLPEEKKWMGKSL